MKYKNIRIMPFSCVICCYNDAFCIIASWKINRKVECFILFLSSDNSFILSHKPLFFMQYTCALFYGDSGVWVGLICIHISHRASRAAPSPLKAFVWANLNCCKAHHWLLVCNHLQQRTPCFIFYHLFICPGRISSIM